MIHTICIDDSTLKGKQIVESLHKETEIVRFINTTAPEGYLTVEEFIIETDKVIKKQFVKHGLLKFLKLRKRAETQML